MRYRAKQLSKINALRRTISQPDIHVVPILAKGKVLFVTAAEMHDEPASCANCIFYNEEHSTCQLIGPHVEIKKFTHGEPDKLIEFWPCCFAGETEVYTGGDFVPMRALRVGMEIPQGRISRIIKRKTNRLVKLRIWGWPDAIRCTPEHPFLVDKEWRNASELRKGDALTFPILPEKESDKSEDEWWLIGRYLADGWSSVKRSETSWSAGWNKRNLLEKTKKICERLWPQQNVGNPWHGSVSCKRHRAQIFKAPTCFRYTFTSQILSEMCSLFGTDCYTKKLTPEAMCLPKEKAMALWDGYFSGDGCMIRGKQIADSSSKNLLLDFKMLLGRFGIRSSVQRGRKQSGMMKIRGRIVYVRPSWRITVSLEAKRYFKVGRVRSTEIIRIAPKTEVYDLTIEGQHQYSVGGVTVHNCGMQTYGEPNNGEEKFLTETDPSELDLIWINAPEVGQKHGGATCGGANGADDCDHYQTDKIDKRKCPTGFCRVLQTTVSNGDVCTAWNDDDKVSWQEAQAILRKQEAETDGDER